MSFIVRYVRFWDRRESAESLALVRIGVGLVSLLDLLQVAHYGLVRALWAPIEDGGIGPSSYAAPRVLFYTWFGASSTSTYALFGLSALAACMVTLGLGTRLSALVLLFGSAELSALAPDSDRGIDSLLRSALALLALSGAGATWSLDARLRAGSFYARTLIPAWPRYLLIGQLCLVYFTAGMLKQSPEWTRVDGYSALFRVLSTPHVSRIDWSHALLSQLYPLLQVATVITLLFESCAMFVPLLLWLRGHPERGGRLGWLLRRARALELWIATGVVFHLLLAALTKLGIFPWGCLALYPAFARPDQWRSLFKRARVRRAAVGASTQLEPAVGLSQQPSPHSPTASAPGSGSQCCR